MQSAGLRVMTYKTIRQWQIDKNQIQSKIFAINSQRLFSSNKEQPKGHNENQLDSFYKSSQRVRIAASMPSKDTQPKTEHQSETNTNSTTWQSNDYNNNINNNINAIVPSTSTAKPKLPHIEATNTAWSTEDNKLVDNQKSTNLSKLTSNQMRQDVEGYMFTRFFDHVKNYDKLLEKNFPSAMKVYRTFFDGVKYFFSDMKNYLKISRIVHMSPNGLKALNRKELELYMRMPRDMIKIAPTLIATSLPMIGYAIFPIV